MDNQVVQYSRPDSWLIRTIVCRWQRKTRPSTISIPMTSPLTNLLPCGVCLLSHRFGLFPSRSLSRRHEPRVFLRVNLLPERRREKDGGWHEYRGTSKTTSVPSSIAGISSRFICSSLHFPCISKPIVKGFTTSQILWLFFRKQRPHFKWKTTSVPWWCPTKDLMDTGLSRYLQKKESRYKLPFTFHALYRDEIIISLTMRRWQGVPASLGESGTLRLLPQPT